MYLYNKQSRPGTGPPLTAACSALGSIKKQKSGSVCKLSRVVSYDDGGRNYGGGIHSSKMQLLEIIVQEASQELAHMISLFVRVLRSLSTGPHVDRQQARQRFSIGQVVFRYSAISTEL